MADRPPGSLIVEVTPPYDFGHSIRFLDGFSPCAGDHRCETDRLVTGGFADGRAFLVHVFAPDTSPDGTTELPLEVEWIDGPADPAAVRAWLAAFLSLDDDLGPLYDAAAGDPVFENVVEALYGLHHVRFPTPFECASWAGLSQRTPMELAAAQKRALVDAAGRVVDRDGATHRLFPTPEMVLERKATVREALTNERKVKTVVGAAELFARTDLGRCSDERLREHLQSVWGFGEWSSEFVSLRGFGRLDRVPTSERRLRTVVADRYDLETDVASEADLNRLGGRYGKMKGYWAHYLRVWAFLRDGTDGR